MVRYRHLDGAFEVKIKEQEHQVRLIEVQQVAIRLEIDQMQYRFEIADEGTHFYLHNEQLGNLQLKKKERFAIQADKENSGGFEAPMPSTVVKVLVEKGQSVKAGDPLIVLSSMKMENTIYTEKEGLIEEVYATEGSNVEAGFLLLKMQDSNS